LPVAIARFQAGYDLLKQNPLVIPDKIAAIGYCFGGGVVLHMARIGMDLKGVATFHGMLAPQTAAKPGSIKAKILVMTGGDDPFVPADVVAAFRKEMAAAGANYQVIVYPGVKHSFTNPAATENGKKFNLPLVYDKKADQQSWASFKKFASETL